MGPLSAMGDRQGPWPPDFLILGAQKSATTSLASALRCHPEVFVPPVKEAQHFGRVTDSELGGAGWTRTFSGWRGEPMVGEATPDYLILPRSAEQICRNLPQVRAVVSLRNPVDRAWSAYWNGRRIGRLRHGFERLIDDELAHGERPDRWFGDLLARGRYAEQLGRFLDLGLDRTRLLVVFFDDLMAEPAQELVRVQRFLGLEPVVTSFPQENRTSASWLPRPLRVALSPHYTARWAQLVERSTRRSFRPPPMDPVVRARLVDHFRPHNARLAELLGCDLPDWDR